MTTPTDPPKPTRWRRQQLEMRLRKAPPPGAERRGARAEARGGAAAAGRGDTAARAGSRKAAKAR
jgi:hypothetical protein